MTGLPVFEMPAAVNLFLFGLNGQQLFFAFLRVQELAGLLGSHLAGNSSGFGFLLVLLILFVLIGFILLLLLLLEFLKALLHEFIIEFCIRILRVEFQAAFKVLKRALPGLGFFGWVGILRSQLKERIAMVVIGQF